MSESLWFFAGIAILLFFILRYLIKSESNGVDTDEKLKTYAHSSLFQDFYKKHPYRKLSKVIKGFEKDFPVQAKKMVEEKTLHEGAFDKNRDRYNYLIFKYYEELKALKGSGIKFFSKNELQRALDSSALDSLLESNVITCHNDKYLLQEKYEADHPFEVDSEGKPLKIEI